MRIRGKDYLSGNLHDYIVENGKITLIQDANTSSTDIGGINCWVAPGLIDIQVNGYKGLDFCGEELDEGDVHGICQRMTETGVTAFCPTITTNPYEIIVKNLKVISTAVKNSKPGFAKIIGIHLEGPYISAEMGPRGAHPLAHIRRPDWDEFLAFQDAADGLIKLVTLAPELEGALDFISKLNSVGVRVAIGHHQASLGIIKKAIEAGAVLSTHLGNGAHSLLPRHPNYIWDQIAEDKLSSSLIVDGHHIPSSFIKVVYRVKGVSRIILISDVIAAAGLAEGRHKFMGLSVDVTADGSIKLSDTQYLAGSSVRLCDSLAIFIRCTNATFSEAIQMVTTNPAFLLGIERDHGVLETGRDADISIFSDKPGYNLLYTIKRGEISYSHQI